MDAHAEECFFDRVKKGTKMGLMFEVAEGGFLDIDVRIEGNFFTCNLKPIILAIWYAKNVIDFFKILQCVWTNLTGPDGGIVHSGERESNGKYTFAAHQEGTYKYCFSNKVIN